MTFDPPISRRSYEELAEAYAAKIDTKPHNAYYERPATLSLLPEVRGLRVLDAGCGPGVYAEWMTNRGARVVAVDASPKMLALARARVGPRVAYHGGDGAGNDRKGQPDYADFQERARRVVFPEPLRLQQ
jgi:SAM-dependent methyltransferase